MTNSLTCRVIAIGGLFTRAEPDKTGDKFRR